MAERDQSLPAGVAARVHLGQAKRHSASAQASPANVGALVLRRQRVLRSVKRHLRSDAVGRGDSAQRLCVCCGVSLSLC